MTESHVRSYLGRDQVGHKEFETIGPDGRMYIHEDNWDRWRWLRCEEYPCPQGQYRFDITLTDPRDRLEDVPVERNPHSYGHGAHECFYVCSDWSTIYGVHDAHTHNGESYRMLVQSGCPEPIWGERITLMSTSSFIENEPWGRNPANKFAYFRGKCWRIRRSVFLHEWRPPIRYPLSQCTPARLQDDDQIILQTLFIPFTFRDWLDLANTIHDLTVNSRWQLLDDVIDCEPNWIEEGF